MEIDDGLHGTSRVVVNVCPKLCWPSGSPDVFIPLRGFSFGRQSLAPVLRLDLSGNSGRSTRFWRAGVTFDRHSTSSSGAPTGASLTHAERQRGSRGADARRRV